MLNEIEMRMTQNLTLWTDFIVQDCKHRQQFMKGKYDGEMKQQQIKMKKSLSSYLNYLNWKGKLCKDGNRVFECDKYIEDTFGHLYSKMDFPAVC